MRIDCLELRIAALGLSLAGFLVTGCAQHTPSIAHVHVGHALTGAHDTPGTDGYFVVAEKRADMALQSAEKASEERDLETLKSDVEKAVTASESEKDFGVKQALSEAANHIAFAATSPDASENLKLSEKTFRDNINAVLDRCELITLLGNDVRVANSQKEGIALAREISLLAYANIHGEDIDGDGIPGSVPEEYGLVQLRDELKAMVGREDPPYETVDRWYLFNLIRMPSGEWVFRKWFDGGSSGGYH